VLIVDDHRDTVEMFAEYLTADASVKIPRRLGQRHRPGAALSQPQTHAPRP
jgi:DNA integrity scanning protein DisA with diadenylate cyclase activity